MIGFPSLVPSIIQEESVGMERVAIQRPMRPYSRRLQLLLRVTARHGHHLHKLLETDLAVVVQIDLIEHRARLRLVEWLAAQGRHRPRELRVRDEPVAILVGFVKRLLQILISEDEAALANARPRVCCGRLRGHARLLLHQLGRVGKKVAAQRGDRPLASNGLKVGVKMADERHARGDLERGDFILGDPVNIL